MDQTSDESPAEYLERHVFPVLLPGLEDTLRVAKATERRRCFNPLDHLAAYLYRHNPRSSNRDATTLEKIPFVMEEWTVKPRPPLPLSATLTEEGAATIIQAYYRAYVVRQDPRAQLFRTWQRSVNEERQRAACKIQSFWRQHVARKS